MGRRCMIRGCLSSGCSEAGDKTKVTFHKFPTNPGLRAEWARILRLDVTSVTDWTIVCSRHFYLNDLKNRRKLGCRLMPLPLDDSMISMAKTTVRKRRQKPAEKGTLENPFVLDDAEDDLRPTESASSNLPGSLGIEQEISIRRSTANDKDTDNHKRAKVACNKGAISEADAARSYISSNSRIEVPFASSATNDMDIDSCEPTKEQATASVGSSNFNPDHNSGSNNSVEMETNLPPVQAQPRYKVEKAEMALLFMKCLLPGCESKLVEKYMTICLMNELLLVLYECESGHRGTWRNFT